jgi:hypothetical protein
MFYIIWLSGQIGSMEFENKVKVKDRVKVKVKVKVNVKVSLLSFANLQSTLQWSNK